MGKPLRPCTLCLHSASTTPATPGMEYSQPTLSSTESRWKLKVEGSQKAIQMAKRVRGWGSLQKDQALDLLLRSAGDEVAHVVGAVSVVRGLGHPELPLEVRGLRWGEIRYLFCRFCYVVLLLLGFCPNQND